MEEEGIEGLRKWPFLRVGFPPDGETMSSFLTSMMFSISSSIVVEVHEE